jgi:hypothetical protein
VRTGLLAGLIAAGSVLLLNFGQALTNADFIYMCAGAALIDGGRLPASPYFPPGYPALLWLVTRAGLCLWHGMTALHAGAVLSALGTGLSVAALVYGARLYRVPPAPALLLGLLGASLPDVAEIAFNPHVDALFTGLALTLIVATLRIVQGKAGAGAALAACACAALLLGVRWHAVLVVGPCLLVLLVTPARTAGSKLAYGRDKLRRPQPLGLAPRRAGLALLTVAALTAGYCYWGLYATTGRLQSAAALQVATGAVYRGQGSGTPGTAALPPVFTDYAAWMQQAPPVTNAMLLEAVRANWPQFLLRKAVLAGVGLCLLLALVHRRWPAAAQWLLLFIAGYSAAVSTTYFTPRASALVELTGLLLAAAGLGLIFTQEEHELGQQKLSTRRLHVAPNGPSLRVNTAALGSLLALGMAAATGYDAWRVQRDLLAPWHARRAERQAVFSRALELAGGEPEAIYGRFDFIPPAAHMPWCLPGPSYSRLWLDDPRVARLVGGLLPEVAPEELLGRGAAVQRPPDAGTAGARALHSSAPTDVRVVLLWPTSDNPRDIELAGEFDAVPTTWLPVESPSAAARLWVRTPTPATPVLTPPATAGVSASPSAASSSNSEVGTAS